MSSLKNPSKFRGTLGLPKRVIRLQLSGERPTYALYPRPPGPSGAGEINRARKLSGRHAGVALPSSRPALNPSTSVVSPPLFSAPRTPG